MADNNTTVVDSEKDILEILQQPGAENIITATEKTEGDDKKPTFFQRKTTDLTFLDNPTLKDQHKSPDQIAAEKATADANAETKKKEGIANGTLNPDGTPKSQSKESFEEILDTQQDNLTDEEKKNQGRPRLDKNGLLELTKKLIEKKMLIPFEDDKKLEDYTLTDFEELYEANDQDKLKRYEEEVPVKFFDSLPEKLKQAAAYAANGGTDMKGLFRALAEYEETAELSTDDESGQEAIARRYLQITKFGTSDEIEAQVNEWKDHEILEKKANQFKPKLDTLKEQEIALRVKEQENLRKKQQEHAEAYMKDIYKVLEPGELNGVKLDKKVQGMIYTGLIQPNYPSISGKNTNLLGHLLEKYQFVEPRHDLIAEALWLLADPDGYKAKLREGGKKEAVASTVRTLKTEESKKIISSSADEGDLDESKKGERKIARPSGSSFFKRG